MGAIASMVGAAAPACSPYFFILLKYALFAPKNRSDLHFSSVYLQKNDINLKYAKNMYEKPKII